MGRKKIDTNCKLPEGKINSTFTKRKRGAVNKAKQLGKLCDVDVALIAFHPRKDAVIAVSHGGKVDEIINRFQDFKQQNSGKVELLEELRMQPHQLEQHPTHPKAQLEQHQMHPNTQLEQHQMLPQTQLEQHQMLPQTQLEQHQMHPQTQLEQHQMHPQTQLEQYHMHSQTQLQHLLPPTFELQMQVGMPMGQLVQAYDVQAQVSNGSLHSQQPLSQDQLLQFAPPPPDFHHNSNYNYYGP